jgi:hypothetical protein
MPSRHLLIMCLVWVVEPRASLHALILVLRALALLEAMG